MGSQTADKKEKCCHGIDVQWWHLQYANHYAVEHLSTVHALITEDSKGSSSRTQSFSGTQRQSPNLFFQDLCLCWKRAPPWENRQQKQMWLKLTPLSAQRVHFILFFLFLLNGFTSERRIPGSLNIDLQLSCLKGPLVAPNLICL